jgi:hypothetical protein
LSEERYSEKKRGKYVIVFAFGEAELRRERRRGELTVRKAMKGENWKKSKREREDWEYGWV